MDHLLSKDNHISKTFRSFGHVILMVVNLYFDEDCTVKTYKRRVVGGKHFSHYIVVKANALNINSNFKLAPERVFFCFLLNILIGSIEFFLARGYNIRSVYRLYF